MSSSDFFNSFEVLASEGKHYTTFRLKDNGLKVTVVACETPFNSIHSQVIYNVGSADEKVGFTGSTHLLEHLMFKSSANPAVKNIFDVMEPAGATINATTSFDRTNFYCTYGAQFLPRWCKAEAMRMQTAPFSEALDAKEKQVVQDELRIGLDNPFQRLRSHVMNTAFNRSGYAVDTGGYMKDVAQVSFDRLKKFHKDFYGPNNAHIVVVGAVSPKFVLRHVHLNFASIPSEGRVPDRTDREEEPQRGARQVAVNVESPVCMLMMSYRNMEGRHRDSIVSEVIAAYLKHPSAGVLAQLSDMAVLPQALVENGRQRNRFLFSIVGSLISDLPQLQQVAVGMIHAALQKLKTEPIDEGVLALIKKDIDNKWSNSKTNVESLGSQLTEAVAMGNIADVWQRHDVLKSVSTADITRVANYLFQDERMTMGIISKRKTPLVQRPLKSDGNYSLMTAPSYSEPKSPLSGAFTSKDLSLFKPLEERTEEEKNFGLYHRLAVSSANRIHLLITAKANTKNSALSKVASRLIKEGLPKLKASHNKENGLAHYRKEGHASLDRDQGFLVFLIENNVDFQIDASMGKMSFVITFDADKNPEFIMTKLAKAIRSLNYTSEEHEKEIQMKTQMLKGQWQAAKFEPRFLAEQEITHRIFAPEDINRSANPEQLVQQLSTITFADIESFKNDLLAKDGKPMVVSVAAKPEVADESIVQAVEAFHRILSPKFYENKAFTEYTEEHLPRESKPSKDFPVAAHGRYLVKQLNGRNEGLSAIGVRVDLNKNDPEYTALAVGIQCLGGGMNSAYNNVLRKEKGWTYGTYARLRGGNQDSSSWVYSFGSFDMKNMPNAVPLMRKIYENFCEKGITKEDFEIKRSNFEKSLKVRLENVNTLLGMTHNTVLNGNKVTFKDILDRSTKLTLQDVNNAIKKHLKGKPFVHVLCGDFQGNNIKM